MFDRLLFLKQGKSVYFGDIGRDSKCLTEYFEKRGARKCRFEENPAEWLLVVTSGALGSKEAIDWADEWQNSKERQEVQAHLADIREALSGSDAIADSTAAYNGFAVSFINQLWIVTRRTLANDWRTPSYLYSKVCLIIGMVCDLFLMLILIISDILQ